MNLEIIILLELQNTIKRIQSFCIFRRRQCRFFFILVGVVHSFSNVVYIMYSVLARIDYNVDTMTALCMHIVIQCLNRTSYSLFNPSS